MTESLQRINEVADILAAGILRLHRRDVLKYLKNNDKTEIGLEVSTRQSLLRLEPKQRGERR